MNTRAIISALQRNPASPRVWRTVCKIICPSVPMSPRAERMVYDSQRIGRPHQFQQSAACAWQDSVAGDGLHQTVPFGKRAQATLDHIQQAGLFHHQSDAQRCAQHGRAGAAGADSLHQTQTVPFGKRAETILRVDAHSSL